MQFRCSGYHPNTKYLQPSVWSSSVVSPWPSNNSSAMFPRPSVWPSSIVGWVHTSSYLILPPCLWAWDFSYAEPRNFLRVLFASNMKDVGSAFFMILGSPSFERWISFSMRLVPWLGLIPQTFLRAFVVAFLESFNHGLGLNPHSLATMFPTFFFGGSGFEPPKESFLIILEWLSLALLLAPNCCREVRQWEYYVYL